MSDERFTPGPWEVEETDDGHAIKMGQAIEDPGLFPSHMEVEYNHGCFYEDRYNEEEREGYSKGEHDQAEEAEANAYLMAAAPDMYEALERAQQFIANGIELGYVKMPDADSGDSALNTPGIIRKALAKARGDE